MTRTAFGDDELAVVALSAEVKRFAVSINASSATLLRPLGVTPVQADALMTLKELGPATLRDLGAILVAEAGHPSRLVSRLETEGWVIRRRGDIDRRELQIELTDAGHELVGNIIHTLSPLLQTVSEAFGSQVSETYELLQRMRGHLETYVDRDGDSKPEV